MKRAKSNGEVVREILNPHDGPITLFVILARGMREAFNGADPALVAGLVMEFTGPGITYYNEKLHKVTRGISWNFLTLHSYMVEASEAEDEKEVFDLADRLSEEVKELHSMIDWNGWIEEYSHQPEDLPA